MARARFGHSLAARPSNSLSDTGPAQKVDHEFSTAEQRFFAELEQLRESDPDEFDALSPATKASYGTWRYARDHSGEARLMGRSARSRRR
jgi:hypothetical protein